MDQQRTQAYVGLIDQLLSCASGEEGAMLQRHADLVDAGLLAVMAQVADFLEQQGNSNALWLRQFADMLENSTVETAASEQFLREILQLTAESQGDAQQVYPVLGQHQDKLNESLLQVLPEVATQIFANNPERRQVVAAVLSEFGNLINQFPLGQRWLNLELGIVSYQQALTVRTQRSMPIDWATTMNNLANAYYYRIRGDRGENIEQAIEAYQQVLTVRTQRSMPVDWARTMNNLANAYRDRIRGDRGENIEQAIEAYQQALTVMTQRSMLGEWAGTMMNLAIAYSERIRGDRGENIEQAIKAYQQALTVTTQRTLPVDWARTMMNLALAYSERIRGDRGENIEQAIEAYQQALTVLTQRTLPVEWATTMNNLANAYRNRIRGDRGENIEQAIEAYQQALTVRTQRSMPIDWATTMNNLANAYSKSIRGDRGENIEQAIEAYQQALTVRTQRSIPIDWARTMMNLASAYSERIRGDRGENIEQAIEAYQQALTVMTQRTLPVDWARTMMNLAIAYSERIRGDKGENIERAIEAYQQALTVRTQRTLPIDWAGTMNNLALAYRDRIRGDRGENIERAIKAYQQALTVLTQRTLPVEWATTMMNLALAYSERIRGNRSENIEQAIEAYQQALTVMTQRTLPVDWARTMMNLALAYRDRIRGDRGENIERAIEAYQQALDVFRPDLLPNDCRRTARSLANLLAEEQRWAEALQPYDLAVQAAEILYQSSLFRNSQEAELAETNDLYRRAAYALARAGNLKEAAVTLERGRARGLSETLQRDQADLEQVSQSAPALYRQYQQAVEQLRQLQAAERATSATLDSPPLDQATLRQQGSQIRDQLQAAIQSIRQLPGYSNFLAQPDFADLAAAVKPGVAIVYLVPTPNGSLALLLHHDLTHTNSALPSIQPIWLDSLTEARLQELLVGSPQAEALDGWFGAYNNRQSDRQPWFNTIDRITAELWQGGIGTLVQALSPLSLHQAVLIPTGYLSLLPLHAAWTADDTTLTQRRYALDLIPFTYAPNAQSLCAAQAIADRTPATSLLAIDQPSHTEASPLPNSTREIETAIATFPQRQIFRHDEATTKAILAALPQHNVLHFSCHGYATLDEPLNSGLALAGKDLLTLRELLDLKLSGVRLAILSACETGLPGTQLPDEVVSLPTGLLQAGVAGVIASLWSVADLSTMMLLARFYGFWRQDNLEPAVALRQAQQWLRDTTNDEKLNYFEGFLPAASGSKMTADTAEWLSNKFFNNYHPDDRSFAHPFHWAAFSYVGV